MTRMKAPSHHAADEFIRALDAGGTPSVWAAWVTYILQELDSQCQLKDSITKVEFEESLIALHNDISKRIDSGIWETPESF